MDHTLAAASGTKQKNWFTVMKHGKQMGKDICLPLPWFQDAKVSHIDIVARVIPWATRCGVGTEGGDKEETMMYYSIFVSYC